MTALSDHPAGDERAPGSGRVRLAQLSCDVALRVPGVAGLDSGPTGLFVTAGGRRRIEGVRCVAAGNGVYELSLRLRCELVPLRELGETVRVAVGRAASRVGVTVTEINVLIADVASAELG